MTAIILAFWAAHSDAIITVVVVPAAGWLFTRATIATTSDEWDGWRKRHPYWTAFIVWAREWGPNAAAKVLAKRGVVLVDTNKLSASDALAVSRRGPAPDPLIGTRIVPEVPGAPPANDTQPKESA